MLHRFIKKNLILLLFLAQCFIQVIAQEKDSSITEKKLPEVHIVEKKRSTPTQQAAPFQIVTNETMKRLGFQELSDAVKHFSGIQIKDYGGIGGLKTVSVRNLGVQHTAICYDGIAINNSQSGQTDISRFSLDNIENITLTIGQSDDIFQSARMYASAGSLQIKTITPNFKEKPFNTHIRIKTGSFGMFAPSIRHEQKLNDRIIVSLHTDWQSAKGNYPFTLTNGDSIAKEKRKNTDIQSLRLEGNFFVDWEDKGRLDTKIYHYNSERGLPGSVILYNDYARERLWNKNTFIQTRYLQESGILHWQIQGKFNHAWDRYIDIHNKYESGKQEDRHLQREYYASASGVYLPAKNWKISLSTDFFINTLHSNIPDFPFPTRYTSLNAIALQYKTNRFSSTASLLGTYIVEDVKTGSQPANRKRLSPALSTSWRIWADKNIRVRLSYKDIYRTPTFNDLYYLRVGNRNLKPEKAIQYNIGVTWSTRVNSRIPYISGSIDGYHNRVHNKISAIPTLYIWKMMNLGEVSIYGTDLNLQSEFSINKKINAYLQATYTWQKAIDITDPSAKNYKHQIAYTPKHTGVISIAVENPLLNVSYQLAVVDKRYALPQNIANNEMKGYIDQSISVNKEFRIQKWNLRLQGEIINIGNTQYDVIKSYPMPGRSFRFTMHINI